MGTMGPGSELFIAPGQDAQVVPPPMTPAYSYTPEKEPEKPEPENLETGVQSRKPAELEAFMTLAKERYRKAAERWKPQFDLAAEDMRFRLGEQWPDDIKTQREMDKRPCITINRIPQFIRQVTNDERQNRPSIHVTPRSEFAKKTTADIIEGVVRSIEMDNADVAYDYAFDFAATTGGPGWIRVFNEYESEDSFKQRLVIRRTLNNQSVIADPDFQEPDGSDMNYCFVVQDYTPEEYKAEFGDEEMASLNEFSTVAGNSSDWITEKNIRVAEYWYKKPTMRTLVQLADGREMFEDEGLPEGVEVTNHRKVKTHKIMWAKINAVKPLQERTDYKGKYIPLVPVLGEELFDGGSRKLSGVVRYAKDPQRAYNYWTSAQTEMIALAPKAPLMPEIGQIEGLEQYWKKLNTSNLAYLPYKAKALEGTVLPAPGRVDSNAPIQATAVSRSQAADDLKATTGLYDASIGAQGNETSGRAILARQREGDVANFHLIDNLTKSIRHVGRILVDLIPYVYDTPRVERIVGSDQRDKMVKIQSSMNPNVQPLAEDQDTLPDVERIYDLGVGKYDVAVVVGPSYTTRRQEAAASMVELTRSFPQLTQLAGDLVVRSMDWPMSDKIADRLHKLLPPELQEQEGDDKPPIPPQVQAQMQALMQQHEALTELVNKLMDEREKKTLELASRERIASLQTQANLIMTYEKIASQEGIEMLKAKINEIGVRLDALAKFEAQQGMETEDVTGAQPMEQAGANAGADAAVASSELQAPTGSSELQG